MPGSSKGSHQSHTRSHLMAVLAAAGKDKSPVHVSARHPTGGPSKAKQAAGSAAMAAVAAPPHGPLQLIAAAVSASDSAELSPTATLDVPLAPPGTPAAPAAVLAMAEEALQAHNAELSNKVADLKTRLT
jgi:hypothetical protein